MNKPSVMRLLALALLSYMLVFTAAAQKTAVTEPVFKDLSQFAPPSTFLEEGKEPEWLENGYRDQNIAIKITKHRHEEARADYYVADIYLTSVKYFQRGFSNNDWKQSMQSIKTISTERKAILSMTGDYASLLSSGLVAANGTIYRSSPNRSRDNCFILTDGRMLTYSKAEIGPEEALKLPLWHSFLFGPALLQDGKAINSFRDKIRVSNPRSAMGYYHPGHYCFVVVDGRSPGNRGITLEKFSQLMEDLGCKSAYNLDGGQSAILWFNGDFVNAPYRGGRRLTDIVFIGPGSEDAP